MPGVVQTCLLLCGGEEEGEGMVQCQQNARILREHYSSRKMIVEVPTSNKKVWGHM